MRIIKTVNSAKNHAVVGEIYKIDGHEKEVTKITDRYVYLNNKPFDAKMFNFFARQCKTTQPIIKIIEKTVESSPISLEPIQSLRFVLMLIGEEKYQFIFARKHTSHSELVEEYKKLFPQNCLCIGGGFYTSITANANLDATIVMEYDKEDLLPNNKYFPEYSTIVLFGKSDTYGLNMEELRKAMWTNMIYLKKSNLA